MREGCWDVFLSLVGLTCPPPPPAPGTFQTFQPICLPLLSGYGLTNILAEIRFHCYHPAPAILNRRPQIRVWTGKSWPLTWDCTNGFFQTRLLFWGCCMPCFFLGRLPSSPLYPEGLLGGGVRGWALFIFSRILHPSEHTWCIYLVSKGVL